MKDNTATEYAKDRIYAIDSEAKGGILLSKEYIETLDTSKLFLEKLFVAMSNSGYTGSCENSEEMLEYLKIRFRKFNIPVVSRTLKNWVYTGKVSHNEDGRRNIYKLCFALEMNAQGTKEFFMQAVLERPFNCKILYEAVCCFCLTHRKPYSDVERLVSQIETMPKSSGEEEISGTVAIFRSVEACQTEDDLIDYWITYSNSFGMPRKNARQICMSLIENCYEITTENSSLVGLADDEKRIKNLDQLLSAIYGYDIRKIDKGNKKRKGSKSIAFLNFPEAINRNLTQRQQLENIIKGKASDEVLRKAIIILSFYLFFKEEECDRRWKHAKHLEGNIYDDFLEEVNERLTRCGLTELYFRNPFDWMFGYCAFQKEPIAVFQDLVEKFYHTYEESDIPKFECSK